MVNEVAGITFRADSRDVKTATKDLDRMSGAAGRSEKAATRMARGVRTAFAALGVGLVIRGIIQNTVAQEQATAQLNATLQSTGRYTPQLSQALKDYAKQLQDVTTFGDEAIITAQSQLATFTKLGSEIFPLATEAALDMSVKMGTDLKESIVQVGKALQDPILGITALRRVGVNFSDAQKDVIKRLVETNRLAEAQAMIVNELRVEFGGSARAARDTFGGALKGVQNAIGDLLEADGDSLPALVTSLNNLEDQLNSPSLQRGFGLVTTGIVNLTRGGATAISELGSLGDQLGAGFAAIAGNLSLEDEIQQELNAVDRAIENSFLGKPLQYLFTPLEELKRIRAGFVSELETIRRTGGTGNFDLDFEAPGASSLDFSGLDTATAPALEIPAEITVQGRRIDDLGGWWTDMLREAQAAAQEATGGLTQTLNELAAESGGPVVQAGLRLADTLAMIEEHEQRLIATSQLNKDTQAQLASARALATQQYERELEAIEAQKTPAEELIERLQLETELIGLSNIERERRIALQLAGKDATDEEIAEIERLIQVKGRLEETERAVGELRSAGEDALASFISGSKSASDAFQSFADQVIADVARMLAEKALAALFGAGSGGAPGGDAGGLFGTIASTIFGPGRALGGAVQPGRIHPVTERGEPEVLTVGQRQYLITGNQGGMVQPVSNTVNQGSTHLTVNLPPEERRRSASSLAANLMREAGRAQARNR